MMLPDNDTFDAFMRTHIDVLSWIVFGVLIVSAGISSFVEKIKK